MNYGKISRLPRPTPLIPKYLVLFFSFFLLCDTQISNDILFGDHFRIRIFNRPISDEPTKYLGIKGVGLGNLEIFP